MKQLFVALVLLGVGNGIAMAEGDGGLYVLKTMRQVQTGDYSYRIDRNGEEHLR